MSLDRSVPGRNILVLDPTVLTDLLDAGSTCLDLNHPSICAITEDDVIHAIEFDSSVDDQLAARFDSLSVAHHPVQLVFPEETLKLFVNIRKVTLSGFKDRSVDEWPEWIFLLFGVQTIINEEGARIDVGGLEKIEASTEDVVDGTPNTVRDAACDEDELGSGSDEHLHINTARSAVAEMSNSESLTEEPMLPPDSSWYRFRLTRFKLLSMFRHKKKIVDLSARSENPFTRGSIVKEIIIG